MRERATFEREIEATREGFSGFGNLSFRSRLLSCANFREVQGGVCEADISGDAVTSKAVTVTVRYYTGTRPAVALVLSGVHGDEDEGTMTATAVRKRLDAAYAATPPKRAAFHTFLIENLRAARDAIDPPSADVRWVDGIEPNRNFPLPGEGLAAAVARVSTLGFELVDPDARRFPKLSPRNPDDFKDKQGVKRASKTIIPENRILLNLIACIKPARAASIHSHSISSKRGDAPGVFVDPRGGFDTDLDAPLTADGRTDDMLADGLLKEALKRLDKSKLTTAERAEALQGNRPRDGNFFGETVHYSFGAPKARGTSFGMWAPAPVIGHGPEDRPAIQTITLELPKWLANKKKAQAKELADLWAGILVDRFLEVA